MPALFTDFPVSGIGSLPFNDPAPALDLIARYMPLVPHWPQLPRRSRDEHFTRQYLGLLTELGLLVEGRRSWGFAKDAPYWVEGLTRFYDIYLAAAAGEERARQRFAPSRQAAAGLYAFLEAFAAGRFAEAVWVKGQIAGPLSVGLNLFDQDGRPAYYHPQLRELVVKCLAQGAAWQAQVLAQCGLPVVLFVDDPAVGAWGTSTHVGLDREAIIADLAEVVAAIKKVGAIPGAHSCAGVDWSILLAAGFEVLSFDAYGYFSSLLPYARELKEFLTKGGILAWGIVPTSAAAWEQTPASLASLWQEEVEELSRKELPEDTVRRQSWLTPSCGTGVLEPELARRIYELAAATASALSG